MKKLLIVDDIPQNLYLLEALFKGNGFDVLSARNGAEALALAGTTIPDLVVSDILMPVMDGFELCRRWKADPGLSPVPFIFYTATYTEAKDEEFALSLGAERFVVKPQKPEILIGIVREVLEERRENPAFTSDKPLGEDAEFLRKHNEALFAKLEKKMRELENEVASRTKAESDLRQLNQDLEKRVRERTMLLEAANKELEAFSYSVSHDLRAPLRHIAGFTEVLARSFEAPLCENSRRYIDRILAATRQMGVLIDDLLSFSKMSRQEFSRAQVDLSALVGETIRKAEPETEGRKIEWTVASLPTVSGDRAMLSVVFSNLISNAIKYTRPREVARIEIGTLPGDGRELVLFVRDNGVGFDQEYVDRLFNVFQRLHRVEDFEGTGIGLAIVRRIMCRHGGRTWAEGKVDHGATFYFSFLVD